MPPATDGFPAVGSLDRKEPDRDADLVRRLQIGESAAYTELYRRHAEYTRRVALRVVKNETDVEDITQRVFMMVFQKIGSFRGESKFSTWLHQITTNTALLEVERSGRAKRGGGLPMLTLTSSEESLHAVSAENIEQDLITRETATAVQVALTSLRPEEVGLLQDVVDGRSQYEMANDRGITENALKHRLLRVRKKLRSKVS